jgi:hypothetical protein
MALKKWSQFIGQKIAHFKLYFFYQSSSSRFHHYATVKMLKSIQLLKTILRRMLRPYSHDL